MLNQIIPILVTSFISCIAGWYLGAHCQRRVDDREKERLQETHRIELENAFNAPAATTEPLFGPDRYTSESQKIKIADVVAANSHCCALISDELQNVYSILRDSFSDWENSREFRARIMESAILTHGKLDRLIRSAPSSKESIELLRDLITALGEIEEQSVRVRSIAAEVNLLAANAGLESARAGEAARGFTVFADCMKSLSGKIADTTMRLYKLVDKKQRDLEKMMQSLEQQGEPLEHDVENVLEGFIELENDLTRLDRIRAKSISNLDIGTKTIHQLEHKVHALSDSLSNGLAEFLDEKKFEASRSDLVVPQSVA